MSSSSVCRIDLPRNLKRHVQRMLGRRAADLGRPPLADALEKELGKPVLAINTITWWHALRSNGIPDRMDGFGSLLREH